MLHVMRLSLVWGLLMKKSNRVRRASPSAKHSSRARALQCRIWAFTAERAVVNWHRSFLCILHEDCCLSRPFSLTRSHPKLFHSYTSQTTQLKEGRNERTASLSDQINLASCTFPTVPRIHHDLRKKIWHILCLQWKCLWSAFSGCALFVFLKR